MYFLSTWGQWKKLENTTLTYHHLIKLKCERVSKQLLIYSSSRYEATLAFIFSHVCVHVRDECMEIQYSLSL